MTNFAALMLQVKSAHSPAESGSFSDGIPVQMEQNERLVLGVNAWNISRRFGHQHETMLPIACSP
jgi:hypothetical protein